MKKARPWYKRIWPVLLSLAGLFILLVLLLYQGIIWPTLVFASNYGIQGLDVSSYQGKIDWKGVAQTGSYSFVFIKATEGVTYQDAYFRANWQGTREQGLLRGAYHYFSSNLSGAAQAKNYISLVPRESGMLPPVLDLEVTGSNQQVMLQQIKIFLDLLQSHYGVKPIIYTDHDRYVEYIKGHFDDYPLWIRDVFFPISWTMSGQWSFWQYDSRGYAPGISGFVDLDAFSGTKKQLIQFTS